MLSWAICILEVIIVLISVNLVWQLCKLNRGRFESDPSLGAMFGNAANRQFENSQLSVQRLNESQGYFTDQNILNRARGMLTAPEKLIYTGGGFA
jgi:hypothetical protein